MNRTLLLLLTVQKVVGDVHGNMGLYKTMLRVQYSKAGKANCELVKISVLGLSGVAMLVWQWRHTFAEGPFCIVPLVVEFGLWVKSFTAVRKVIAFYFSRLNQQVHVVDGQHL